MEDYKKSTSPLSRKEIYQDSHWALRGANVPLYVIIRYCKHFGVTADYIEGDRRKRTRAAKAIKDAQSTGSEEKN